MPKAAFVAALLACAAGPAAALQFDPPPYKLEPCAPQRGGRDYQVGPGPGQLAELDLVPWDTLRAGDTVRIFHRPIPYAGKFLVKGRGTREAPIRICGMRGPNGERPVITGDGAVTRRGLVFGSAYAGPIFERRAVIVVKGDENDYRHFPRHITIDGLAVRRAHPDYGFIDAQGAAKRYDPFGACIWIDRGQDVVIADNELSDCSQGLFSRSVHDDTGGDGMLTRNLRIAYNHIHGNGIAGDEKMHNSYVQTIGVVYEFNVYGPPRPGAKGNAIKDRSVGTIVRYNRIEEGAHSIDLVEAEDYARAALAHPDYGTAVVYGNQIVKDGGTGSFFHFGGDHYGGSPRDAWGEANFRPGTLWFFHNTVVVRGNGRLFQLSTTLQSAVAWNNVFHFASSPKYPSLRQSSEIGRAWTAGGVLKLGRNWMNKGWVDSAPGIPVPGEVEGKQRMLSDATVPIDPVTLVPRAGSAIIDAAEPAPSPAAAWRVEWQLDARFRPVPRTVNGAAADLGAIER